MVVGAGPAGPHADSPPGRDPAGACEVPRCPRTTRTAPATTRTASTRASRSSRVASARARSTRSSSRSPTCRGASSASASRREAFLNGVIAHGAHFCTYLLGTDMEMNTPDGFTLMNWETGYGDWIAEPVWDSLRVPALARADRARPRRRHRRRDRQGDPDQPADAAQAPGRARRGAGDRGQGGLGARVLRPARLVGEPRGPRLAGPQAVRLLQRGLPPAPGHQGRAAPPPAAQPDDRGADPGRVQQGRGGPRPARGQHPLRPRPRVGRPDA